MKTIYHFFRLIRITNLLVIGLTMFVIEMFVLRIPTIVITSTKHFLSRYEYYSEKINVFWLLLISTLLIAAAGNIINDYFDVKADRINKPNRLIIGKHIKRRWAMVLHWSFNSLGMIIALYVGYVLQNIWVPLIAFLSINLLWFYSAYYKRRPLIGNLIVALLIGIVPIYVMVFNWPLSNVSFQNHFILYVVPISYFIDVILIVSILAFLQNLVRELVKDIQDIRGDLKLDAKTFPIEYGIKKTKWLIAFFSVLVILVALFYYTYIWNLNFNMQGATMGNGINLEEVSSFNFQKFGLVLFSSLLLFIISFIVIIFFNKNKTYKIAATVLKIAMLFGLLTPLFL